MSITEKFVPHEELLELFGVERNATLMRMLDRNNISYMTNYKKRPLVLRSDIEAFNQKTPIIESEDASTPTGPILEWED